MPYLISNSRNLQIASQITQVATKDDKDSETNALSELLQIDTAKPNIDFLRQFRDLKNTHPFINNLCERSGFLVPLYILLEAMTIELNDIRL